MSYKYLINILLIVSLPSSQIHSQLNSLDNVNWLIGSITENNDTIVYQYDALGNRIQYEIIPGIGCTYTVDNTEDSGLGSLRKAIECSSPGDTIQFDPSLIGQTIELTSTQIELNKDLVFLQSSSEIVNIKALFSGSVFKVTNGSNVYMENVHLFGGHDSEGRALVNQGTLTLKDVHIYDSAIYSGTGSTVLNQGDMILQGECTVERN